VGWGASLLREFSPFSSLGCSWDWVVLAGLYKEVPGGAPEVGLG
jgi:hypothetical protein